MSLSKKDLAKIYADANQNQGSQTSIGTHFDEIKFFFEEFCERYDIENLSADFNQSALAFPVLNDRAQRNAVIRIKKFWSEATNLAQREILPDQARKIGKMLSDIENFAQSIGTSISEIFGNKAERAYAVYGRLNAIAGPLVEDSLSANAL